jgi:uracil-DNA glycosylase
MTRPENDWQPLLKDEYQKPYYLKLQSRLKTAYQTSVVHPSMHDLFNALHFTPYSTVKVVILGQVLCTYTLRLLHLRYTQLSNQVFATAIQ